MSRDHESPPEGEDFAGRVRDELHRGADVARTLITRLRGLLGPEGEPPLTEAAHDTRSTGEAHPPPQTVAPRRSSGTTWTPVEIPMGTHAQGAQGAQGVPGGAPGGQRGRKARAVAAPPPPPPPPSFRDEEGDENELPLEFATATMGHVLIDQGRADDARRIFRAVLARTPGDDDARRGLTRLGDTLGDSPADAPEPAGMLDRAAPPRGYGVSEARALPVDPVSIVVFWELTDADLAHAGEITGWGAERALFVVSMWAGPRGVERIERYIDGVAQLGDWFVTSLPAGATHHAAVGLRRGDRFVPVVHAAPVTTPRGRPAAVPARVRATVALPGHPGATTETPGHPEGPRIVGLAGPRDALAAAASAVGLPPGSLVEAETPATDDTVYNRARAGWQTGPVDSSTGSVSTGSSTSSR